MTLQVCEAYFQVIGGLATGVGPDYTYTGYPSTSDVTYPPGTPTEGYPGILTKVVWPPWVSLSAENYGTDHFNILTQTDDTLLPPLGPRPDWSVYNPTGFEANKLYASAFFDYATNYTIDAWAFDSSDSFDNDRGITYSSEFWSSAGVSINASTVLGSTSGVSERNRDIYASAAGTDTWAHWIAARSSYLSAAFSTPVSPTGPGAAYYPATPIIGDIHFSGEFVFYPILDDGAVPPGPGWTVGAVGVAGASV